MAKSKNAVKLTDQFVKNLEKGEQDRIIFDAEVGGFGIKVTPKGRKVFVIKYRSPTTLKRTTETLGVFPEQTTGKAREAAKDFRAGLRKGDDPNTKRKAERRAALLAETVESLWKKYDREEIEARNKPSTAKQKRRHWETKIKPAIGKLKVSEVSRVDVEKVFLASTTKDPKTGKTRGAAEANNVLRTIRHMFERAETWGMRQDGTNPAKRVKQFKVERRQRLLSQGEVTAIFKTLDEADQTKTEAPQVTAIIRLAFLMGNRVSELLGLQWDYIDTGRGEVRWPDSKTGFLRKPLTQEAQDVLSKVDRVVGVPYVFTAVTDRELPLSYPTIEKAFRRLMKTAKVKGVSLHTIRHWYATQTANDPEISLRDGMTLTGHKSIQAYMNYVQDDPERIKKLAGKVAKLPGTMREGQEKRGETAQLHPANN